MIVWITPNYVNFLKRWKYQTTLPISRETCIRVKKQQLEQDMEQLTGSKLGKENIGSPIVTWVVTQGILSPCFCLFKLYPEYIMQNAEWDES